jgi:hypothetical protein
VFPKIRLVTLVKNNCWYWVSFGIGNNSSAFLGWISQLLRESVGKWKICINQQSDLRKNSCCYCSFILDMSTFKDLGLNWFSHMWTESPRNEALHSPAAEICYPAVATPRKMSNSWKPGNDGENIIEVPSWFHTFLSFWLLYTCWNWCCWLYFEPHMTAWRISTDSTMWTTSSLEFSI